MAAIVPNTGYSLEYKDVYTKPQGSTETDYSWDRDFYSFFAQTLLGSHIARKVSEVPPTPLEVLGPIALGAFPLLGLLSAGLAALAVSTQEDTQNETSAQDVVETSTQDAVPSISLGPIQQISQKPIGILGAGVGGLYAGMILESLGIPYEILEATGRTGGRLFTYKFYNGNEHDYFDVGAMRYPDEEKNPSMTRVFKLFRSEQLNPPTGPTLKERMIPYYMRCDDTFRYYNGVRQRVGDDKKTTTFKFEQTGVLNPLLKNKGAVEGAQQILADAVLNDFIPGLLDDFKDPNRPLELRKGWMHLMEFDNYSTRGYMTLKKGIDPVTVDWVETVTYGTGWFDRALSELILESIAFSSFIDNPKFWCLDGGSRVLPDFMTRYINEKRPKALRLGKRVTEIFYAKPEDPTSFTTPVCVKVDGEAAPRKYAHVISTLPLPVLRSLNIDDAGIDVMQANALRQLQYGPSEKIGVKFKTQWWSGEDDAKQTDGTPLKIMGGQSFSDRVVRTVVYPSYGIKGDPSPDHPKKPNLPIGTVMIASYSWTEDAVRLGSMISAGGALKNQVKELVLRDLSKIHNVSYEFLLEQYEDHFGWDWTHDPLTQGAFAFFGPGEFSSLYKSLTRPAAGGRLHFAGEALSVRHAWVVGALDSAWRAVLEILWVSYPYLIPKFRQLWGENEEWIAPPALRANYKYKMAKAGTTEEEEVEMDTDLVFLQCLTHLGKDFPFGQLLVDI